MKSTTMKGLSVATIALAAVFASADPVTVTVNGNPVQFNDAKPQMVSGRVLVPLRGVFEQMGADVVWLPATQSVVANGNGRHVRLGIGNYDASINGHVVTMDVAPALIDGSTMVPLRFLSQALGAHVDWQAQNDLVAITTRAGAAEQFVPPSDPTPAPTPATQVIVKEVPVIKEVMEQTPPPPPEPRPVVIGRDTVIPLTLDETVSSGDVHQGDHFTSTIQADGGGPYLGFPEGTIVEGYVRSATAADGSHAGTMDLRFTHIKFPDGSRYPIGGFVEQLNGHDIVKTSTGRFVAKSAPERMVGQDAAIGAGAGLAIGSFEGKAVGGAAIGGSIGSIVGALDHHMAHNVIFTQGTRFGLVMNHRLLINRTDMQE